MFPFVNADLPKDQYHTRLDTDTQIHPDIHKLFQNLGLTIGHMEIFHMQPNTNSRSCHIDGTLLPDKWESRSKLNYVIGGTGSTMRWYDINARCRADKVSKNSAIGTVYVPFDFADSVQLEEQALSGWCLIDAGTPHAVFNTSNEKRWSVSVFFKKNNNWVTLTESLEIFSKYVRYE
jgi:hypothetical protein